MADALSAQPRPRLRGIALPTEHGGWGFLLEPIALGLLVAPSAGGALLGLAALGVFLAHHPVTLAARDLRRGKGHARTGWALGFAAAYGLIAALGLAGALWLAEGPAWIALACAAPLALAKLALDLGGRGRSPAAELSGALAFGGLAAAIALAAGWSLVPALALWLIMAGRSVPSILYVRARLRLERGEAARIRLSGLASFGAIALAGALAWLGLAPTLAVIALALLMARALWGLSPHRRRIPARVIGFSELGFGALTVALSALGYFLM